jgi:hypothetical protein
MVGGAAGAAVGLLVAAWADFGGFWPGLVIFLGGTAVGIVLGQLAGRLLFRPSSSGPPDGEKGAS